MYYYRGKPLAIVGLIFGAIIFLFVILYTSTDDLFIATKKAAEAYANLGIHSSDQETVEAWYSWLYCSLSAVICSAVTLVALKYMNARYEEQENNNNSNQHNSRSSANQKLSELKSLMETGIITPEEYEMKINKEKHGNDS